MFLLPQAAGTIDLNPIGATIAIHGFGNVGRYAAHAAQEMKARVVAVSDISGAIYNPDGIDVAAAGKWVDEHRFLEGFPDADFIEEKALFGLDVDVLVPAAIQNVVRADNAGEAGRSWSSKGPTTPRRWRPMTCSGTGECSSSPTSWPTPGVSP
jgi:glutamate dehydrogenase/leucine dehydrogenase